ncbi:aldehyde dehydrogenase family protein [Dietzia sp. ANT_WB102]|uniref:aldehyde dehydrogenase family protein n=1 Tax=Dietzia sp. ANT_WB102 TaxID=2597345 RepID=UPI0011EFDA74|nr:aldehyde dehydrogenase family protein [Dietzia sp. ANT_WB102]KAA0918367.1 aldehyde dehydrogenase family protein [Dietzia sp. ANT_WB102]
MTTTEPRKTGPTFASLDPRDGTVLAEYPIAGPEEVELAVERARAAARWWGAQGPRGRREWLLEYKRAISSRAQELASLVSAETGKPDEDATLEIMLAVSHLEWAAKNADKVLRRRPVAAGLLMSNQAAYVEYQPYGVVGAIGPWNYPVFTPMGTLSYAMAAGNAVVFKPSELTPGVGVWLAEVWDSLGAPQPLIQTITGDGSTGNALCKAGVDKLAFTGSAATGRKVMAACAETLTPVVIEGGGKDALLVDRDADLDAAADQAVFGAMGNAGQTCTGVERIYVHKDVYDAFVQKFTAKARALAPGNLVSSSYGPMTLPGQVDIIRRHVKDAIARGGKAVLGGEESVGEKIVEPVVLVDVPEDSTAVTDETFGPTVVINPVADLEEAVEKANATRYGLGGSIFTGDKKRGLALAGKLDVGMVSINSFLAFAGIPSLPFGGSGDSGFGRIHGADGLREFARPKALTVQRFAAPLNLMTMTRKPRDITIVKWLLANVQGKL